ncbi:hypothetical protein [Streptomyces roseolus]|uniref:hypothetical protein n=1 Tax=Streptomyces roseolus TaxID=67358 RepID=UPI0016798C96|nr:hypothetical protein [Streptomyces roseolus]GGR51367.1 hypothetical protein GCM10010282_50330 [Streptomyces roseolus]
MKHFSAALALVALGVAVYDMVTGQWVWAILLLLMATYLAWDAQHGGVDEPEPESDAVRDLLRKGVEPIETPFDEAPLTWENHTRNCRICQEKNL